jgi:uncharacterized Tic20 family protein
MRVDRPDEPHPQIPLKFRTMAAILHAIFAMPMGLTVGFYLWILLFGSSQMSGKDSQILTMLLYFICINLPMTLILPIISWVIWTISRTIHPFVDLAGRDLLNYTLGNLISTIGLTIMIVIVNGSLYKVAYFKEVSLGILNLVVATFVANSIGAGIFALRGDRYQSILIHPFIRGRQ